MKNQKNKKQHTPIMDGDSRPDKQEERTKPASSASTASSPVAGKKQKKFTIERGADVNKADDFRDAK
jgi:hypothetical protein